MWMRRSGWFVRAKRNHSEKFRNFWIVGSLKKLAPRMGCSQIKMEAAPWAELYTTGSKPKQNKTYPNLPDQYRNYHPIIYREIRNWTITLLKRWKLRSILWETMSCCQKSWVIWSRKRPSILDSMVCHFCYPRGIVRMGSTRLIAKNRGDEK